MSKASRGNKENDFLNSSTHSPSTNYLCQVSSLLDVKTWKISLEAKVIFNPAPRTQPCEKCVFSGVWPNLLPSSASLWDAKMLKIWKRNYRIKKSEFLISFSSFVTQRIISKAKRWWKKSCETFSKESYISLFLLSSGCSELTWNFLGD